MPTCVHACSGRLGASVRSLRIRAVGSERAAPFARCSRAKNTCAPMLWDVHSSDPELHTSCEELFKTSCLVVFVRSRLDLVIVRVFLIAVASPIVSPHLRDHSLIITCPSHRTCASLSLDMYAWPLPIYLATNQSHEQRFSMCCSVPVCPRHARSLPIYLAAKRSRYSMFTTC